MTTDTVGPLWLPVQDSADPAIDKLTCLVKCIVNSMTGEAWGKPGMAPTAAGSQTIRDVFTHDPERESFNTSTLPSVFAWRSGARAAPMQVAEDYRFHETRIELVWVYPPAQQAHQAVREKFAHAVHASLDVAIRSNRCKAWIDEGDTDPKAPYVGSNIRARVGINDINLLTWDRAKVQIGMQGGPPLTYEAARFPVVVSERVRFGTDNDGSLPISVVDGDGGVVLDVTVQCPDEDPALLTFSHFKSPIP